MQRMLTLPSNVHTALPRIYVLLQSIYGTPMMENAATHDEIFIPTFMHTALRPTLKLPYWKGT